MLSGCDSVNSSVSREKTAEELRAELRNTELLEPLRYLRLDSTRMEANRVKVKDNWIRADEYATRGYYMSGVVKNTATLAKYKDVKIVVDFYSKTQTLISSSELVMYEFYEPGSRKSFKQLMKTPEDVETYRMNIEAASAVY